jgi:hypothetical protein
MIARGAASTAKRRPNFFVLGAPKCGTTSLAAWLATHPAIYMSPVKEPHFYNTDDARTGCTAAEYWAMFRAAQPHHRAVGEASVWYLSSSVAVRNILADEPLARFIVMVRSPIEMAVALHAEMLLAGHENVRDFRTAWDLQEERRRGRHLPLLNWTTRRLLYGDVCLLGAQLRRLLTTVSPERVLVIVLDDVAAAPREEYLRVLRFLDVADDGRADFPVHNRARMPRWPGVARALHLALEVKNRLGIDLGANAWDVIASANRLDILRPSPDRQTTALLSAYFADDVRLLGTLLDRDFGHWRTPRDAGTLDPARQTDAASPLEPATLDTRDNTHGSVA